jgi:tetratricopeptide (TPR) repeat protein
MGGKPSRSRQHVYIRIALLILFIGGCATISKKKEVPIANAPAPEVVVEPPVVPEPAPIIEEPKEVSERQEANEYMNAAQSLLARGDFEGSLRESQKVLTLLKDQSPADTAIFHMGLVYAHPKNPKKDNKRAIYFFNRVIKGYPDSAWVEQAKIWVGVLDGVEKLKQVDLEIEERKRDRSR